MTTNCPCLRPCRISALFGPAFHESISDTARSRSSASLSGKSDDKLASPSAAALAPPATQVHRYTLRLVAAPSFLPPLHRLRVQGTLGERFSALLQQAAVGVVGDVPHLERAQIAALADGACR